MKTKFASQIVVKKMCIVAIFAALTFIVTAFIPIPINGAGYFNFSDVFIFMIATLVDPISGGLVGAIGASFADLQAGYAAYMPFTAVIKFFEGFILGIIVRRFKSPVIHYFSFALAGVFMAGAYIIADWVLYDISVAFLAFPFNILQGLINAHLAFFICFSLKKTRLFEEKDK